MFHLPYCIFFLSKDFSVLPLTRGLLRFNFPLHGASFSDRRIFSVLPLTRGLHVFNFPLHGAFFSYRRILLVLPLARGFLIFNFQWCYTFSFISRLLLIQKWSLDFSNVLRYSWKWEFFCALEPGRRYKKRESETDPTSLNFCSEMFLFRFNRKIKKYWVMN